MNTPLPSNDEIEAFGKAIPWQVIEEHKGAFNAKIQELSQKAEGDELPLEDLSDALGIPVSTYNANHQKGNMILAGYNGRQFVLGSFVSKRYRKGKTLLQSVVPYNFNPGVNHKNIHETDNPDTGMRAMGAELELGLYHRDNRPVEEEEVQQFIHIYRRNAHKLGITPQVDREACQYQVEVHIAPGMGYHRMRQSLDAILRSLVVAGKATELNTAIFSAYPIESDFRISSDPKVQTAVDVMNGVNNQFVEYARRLDELKRRYHMPERTDFVEAFRLQGCHIHLDIAGRAESLGLLTFYTMLRSASAIANAAILKGGPFVNGTCDPEYLCVREHLRRSTVTGRYIEIPVSPHLQADGLEKCCRLLQSERANAAVRSLLYDDSLGEPVSVMHNPIGRVRPDLGIGKRICTIESTGMPVNISASRQAAVLADFEFTHVLIEGYFRKYGCDLGPMVEDKTLWSIMGPLKTEDFICLQDRSDREGSDMEIETATGAKMSLAEFYELKRRYMHQRLPDLMVVAPRDIDDVYMSLNRMLDPPSGHKASTIEQYIYDPQCRSTGNWGRILRDAYIEHGGAPGAQNAEAVLRVANRVHEALCVRYL